MIFSSLHFQYVNCCVIFFVLLAAYVHQITFSQKVDSTIAPKQNAVRTETRTKQLQTSYHSSSLILQFRDSIQHRMNSIIDPSSIEQLLEKHPELNDVILKEFIRIHLVNTKELTQQLKRYTAQAPFLEREARRNMERYGVPYDPIRPAFLRTSIDVKQVLRWLLNLP